MVKRRRRTQLGDDCKMCSITIDETNVSYTQSTRDKNDKYLRTVCKSCYGDKQRISKGHKKRVKRTHCLDCGVEFDGENQAIKRWYAKDGTPLSTTLPRCRKCHSVWNYVNYRKHKPLIEKKPKIEKPKKVKKKIIKPKKVVVPKPKKVKIIKPKPIKKPKLKSVKKVIVLPAKKPISAIIKPTDNYVSAKDKVDQAFKEKEEREKKKSILSNDERLIAEYKKKE